MTIQHKIICLALIGGLAMLFLIGPAGSGCASDSTTAAPAIDVDADQPSTGIAVDGTMLAQIGGARLWEQNCMRCHNYRTPASLSDSQWEIVMHHMRVRANLTGEEHRQILAFLKSAN